MWSGATFADRHNHGLQPAQATHAAHIANAILRRGAPEGEAIATANKLVHRDAGGGLDPTQPGVGGPTPSVQTMNPMVQGLVQRYASLPTEKLQELSAMMGGSPQGHIIRAVLQRKLSQPQQAAPQPMPQSPAGMAPVQQQAKGGMVKRAGGGSNPMGVSMSMAAPWWTRQEAYGDSRGSGFLAGSTPGRADSIKTSAPGGSYIVPADVVSGLGEGNSLAGAKVMDGILRSGPYGSEMPRGRAGRGPPRPPAISSREFAAKGGDIHQGKGETPVALSHGEYSVSPEDVTRIGGGDMKRGHRILDRWVVEMRRRHIEKLKKLPPPVKG
jgi:hypothetical protein